MESSLPFLDSRVHRYASGFSFGVYRKPTHSGQYLHFFSFQPEHVKRSTLFSLFLRAYRICDTPFLNDELDVLYTSFKKLGYPLQFINKVHSEVKRKYYGQAHPSPAHETRPTICLPHSEFTNDYVKPISEGPTRWKSQQALVTLYLSRKI